MATQDSNSMMNGTRMQGSEVGDNSFISGTNNAAMAPHSAAIGSNNKVEKVANSAVALGDHTVAYSPYQLVHGKYNDLDANNIYAHIVGGGTDENEGRRNIYTLDWEGNATFAGKVSFGQDIEPTSDNDLINLGYLNDQIVIKYFPQELSEDGMKSTIFMNDLEPYTIYKVKVEGQAQVMFAVRTVTGRIAPFYVSDLSVNRHSMFIGEKTAKEITFFLGSTMYTVNLDSGRLISKEEEKVVVPDSGTGSTGGAGIDDNLIDVNSTWSSAKIAEILNVLDEQVGNSINKVIVEGNEEYSDLVFYNNDDEISRIELPYAAWNITERHILDWNRVQLKITAPDGGESGQILMFDGFNTDYTYSSGRKEVRAKWVHPNEDGGIMESLGIDEIEKKQLMDIFKI